MTAAGGTVCFDSEYYPYGLEMNHASTCSTNYKFTGYERDAETGLDYAFARYYNSRLGRFMSGDPLASSADITDPQTLNRYAYVRNNPVNFADPTGLCIASPTCTTTTVVVTATPIDITPVLYRWCDNADTSESDVFDLETPIFCLGMYENIFGGTGGGGDGGGGGGGGGDVGGGTTPPQKQFSDCNSKNGDTASRANLNLAGYQAADQAAATAGVDTSEVLAFGKMKALWVR